MCEGWDQWWGSRPLRSAAKITHDVGWNVNARILRWTLSLALLTALVGAESAQAQLRLGGGIHYMRNLGDITDDGNIDLSQNSVSIVGSALFDLGLVSLDGQVEYIFNYVGTDEALWQPSAWALLGGLVYGGAGIGIGYTDGAWQNDPFYALRAGVDLPLGGVDLDAYATYRFQGDPDFEALTGEDLDSITFAVLLRFAL